ncbi:AAA family ATPase [Liquorilactobacillus hordei]|uniref:AAA family ATPase n=1 Tax=Liquorilactobacillus hordei TaxID=468911 RepID=UPI001CC04925|nr:AAA family ATPase [Liquorilactobacillus hordei]MBZ2406160.1 hypothetical protein [Liquorilactobacillus hordei]
MSWNEVKIFTPHLQVSNIDLKFFREKGNSISNQRIISIFGRNGSGKTTISNALLHASLNNIVIDEETDPSFCDTHMEQEKAITIPVELNDSEKLGLCVYNEKFVDKYIRVEDNENLEAIVMLSDDPDLRDTLEGLEKEKNANVRDIKTAELNLNNFESSKNNQNVTNIRNKIEEQLKSDGAWASMGKRIHNTKVNQKVDGKAFMAIHDINVAGGTPAIAQQLKELLESDLKHLEQIRQKKELSKFKVLLTDKNNFSNVKKLLSTIISMPNLRGIQGQIMNSLSESGQNQIDITKDIFSRSSTEYCPTCFRKITSVEKEELVQVINQVLDISKQNTEEDFTNQLKLLNLETKVGIDKKTDIAMLFPQEVSAYNDAVNEYNKMVVEYSQAVNDKINNPYTVPDIIDRDSGKLYSSIISTGKEVQKAVEDYNVVFQNENLLKTEAEFLNLNIAKFNNRNLFEQFDTAVLKHKNLEEILSAAQGPREGIERSINEVKAQLAEQKVALDQINNSLAHVFMDRNRIKLIEGDNCYRVQSHGEFIATSQLSVGERNAISLCYFFSRINSNVRADQSYQRPIFVVLDDPISSFDFENKIGILSLLREELEKVLFSNPESKVLVMTHDAEMFYHVAKIYNDIEERRRSLAKLDNSVVPKIVSQCYQLRFGKLIEAGAKSFNDYAQQLQTVYDYAASGVQSSNGNVQNADGDSEQEDLFIGNIMRRVLEAFSTFCYKCSVSAVFNDQDILKNIPDIHQNFIRTFMYRLVFNSESHNEENIKSLTDSNSIDFISHSELVKTAKLLVVFMNDLNSLHLQKLINGFDERLVNTWGQLAV